MSDKIDTRKHILEAARERFSHYGYAKTTMSEIARDCEMSAGNIYRFFASKLDIAEAMAVAFNNEKAESFRHIAYGDLAPPQRLYEFFVFALNETYKKIDAEAKILEIAEILRKERPEFLNGQLAEERVFIVKILTDGVDGGQFRSLDAPYVTAEMIQSSLMKFRFPQAYSNLKLDKLHYELKGVVMLLLAGLSSTAEEPDI